MKYPVLIGSRALDFWDKRYGDGTFKLSPNADWDVISDVPIEGTEWHDPHFLNNAEMVDLFTSIYTVEFNGIPLRVMHMEGLAVIKRSHLWRDLSFQKHITHYHKYLRKYFYPSPEYHHRLDLSYAEFKQSHPKLNKSLDDFFTDGVKKLYDHDWLHELYAYYDEPLYKRLQRDPHSAWCSEDLWDKLNYSDKERCVAEEVQVIATERFLVPNDWNFSCKRAYLQALDKVCTTLCSGYFRDFAIDYYPEIMLMFSQARMLAVKSKIDATPTQERRYFK